MRGKLRRIVEQEKQMLDKNVIKTENAPNIFQTWIQVKKKKHKGRTSKTNRTNDEEYTNVSNAIDSMYSATHLTDVINQEDYQLMGKSKKKKKQHRDRDEELARSLSQLTTSTNNVVGSHPFKFYGVQTSSKIIKRHQKKSRGLKNRKETNNDEEYLSKIKNTKLKDVQTDPIAMQIKNIMKQHPSKKFKVEAEELTPFQKKQLQKSGLRIEFKSQKREKKRYKERTQVAMDFRNLKI